MASQGVFFKTGNSTIDSLFDDSFLFDMDDEYWNFPSGKSKRGKEDASKHVVL